MDGKGYASSLRTGIIIFIVLVMIIAGVVGIVIGVVSSGS